MIAGTATAVVGKVGSSQQQKAAAAQPQGAAAEGLSESAIEQVKQLGELHQAGVLSDEEFAAAKAKLLGL